MRKMIFASAFSILLVPALANAHAKLIASTPEEGAVVAKLPAEINLRFSEPLETFLSKVEAKDPATGKTISTGKVSEGAEGNSSLKVALAPSTSPEKIEVTWKAVSKDSHRAQGKYSFTLQPAKK